MESIQIKEDELFQMIDDTSNLMAKEQAQVLSGAAIAAQKSNSLSNNVEFWKWLDRNFSTSEIFSSNASMNNYIAKGAGKEEWMMKQLQGKGYEWDWITDNRNSIKNIFKTYDPGDVANRAASDVTEYNMLNGASKEYQMKAYTKKTNPDLKNTPKEMTVVTNVEKADIVKQNGYKDVEPYMNNEEIKSATEKRMKQIKDGTATPTYNLKNVAGTMAKAGIVGCAIGISTETIVSYRSWKRGSLSNKEYLSEIIRAGGEAGVTSSATAGLMIPVTAAVTSAGLSSLITIPIAFVFGNAVNKIVAPCFKRGKYRQLLNEAKYYAQLDYVYYDLIDSMQVAAEQYYSYISGINYNFNTFNHNNEKSKILDKRIQDTLDSL